MPPADHQPSQLEESCRRSASPLLGRRRVLEIVQSAMLIPTGVGMFGIVATGCASVLGDQDLDAYFKLSPDKNGEFFGWSEITISGADPKEDDARLKQVLIETIDGDDLTFVTKVIAEAVTPEGRTLLAEGSDFPAGESLAPLDIVHTGGLAEFFPDSETIRIEWTGQADPTYPYPEGGTRINVIIKVEIL